MSPNQRTLLKLRDELLSIPLAVRMLIPCTDIPFRRRGLVPETISRVQELRVKIDELRTLLAKDGEPEPTQRTASQQAELLYMHYESVSLKGNSTAAEFLAAWERFQCELAEHGIKTTLEGYRYE